MLDVLGLLHKSVTKKGDDMNSCCLQGLGSSSWEQSIMFGRVEEIQGYNWSTCCIYIKKENFAHNSGSHRIWQILVVGVTYHLNLTVGNGEHLDQ